MNFSQKNLWRFIILKYLRIRFNLDSQIQRWNFKMNAYALFLTLLISHVYARDVDYCFKEENDPYLYMGTKTAYHFVYHKGRLQDALSKYNDKLKLFSILDAISDKINLNFHSEILKLVLRDNDILSIFFKFFHKNN